MFYMIPSQLNKKSDKHGVFVTLVDSLSLLIRCIHYLSLNTRFECMVNISIMTSAVRKAHCSRSAVVACFVLNFRCCQNAVPAAIQ
jgi:hypothetical protein